MFFSPKQSLLLFCDILSKLNHEWMTLTKMRKNEDNNSLIQIINRGLNNSIKLCDCVMLDECCSNLKYTKYVLHDGCRMKIMLQKFFFAMRLEQFEHTIFRFESLQYFYSLFVIENEHKLCQWYAIFKVTLICIVSEYYCRAKTKQSKYKQIISFFLSWKFH